MKTMMSTGVDIGVGLCTEGNAHGPLRVVTLTTHRLRRSRATVLRRVMQALLPVGTSLAVGGQHYVTVHIVVRYL